MDFFLEATGTLFMIGLLEGLHDLTKPYPKRIYIDRRDDILHVVLCISMIVWVLMLKFGGDA